MKVVAIIQARMGSSRLKGKVLKQIKGKAMIKHIVDRIDRCDNIDDIIVATSKSIENKELIDYLRDNKIKYFIGSENNVLNRYVEAGKYYNADIIVRVTGDNPFTCPKSIDRMIESHIENKSEYTTIMNLPIGVGSEVVDLNTLIKIEQMNIDEYHKEHVTLFIKENIDRFKINIISLVDYEDEKQIRLTVDTPEDFEFACKVYNELYDKDNEMKLEDILELIKRKPELLKINKNIVQKMR